MKRLACCFLLIGLVSAQTPADKGVSLAMEGKCDDAATLLDQSMRDASLSADAKRTVAQAGLRCAMMQDKQNDAVSYLAWLQQAFPNDPQILFLAVRAYRDLSDRNAQALFKAAPDSVYVIQMNAELFEQQNRIPEAVAEYRVLLKRQPNTPGIHYRIGGLLMSQPSADAKTLLEAKSELGEELKVNAQNPGAEFLLGEVARRSGDLDTAATHYRKALNIYPGFAQASFALGRALLDTGKTADAIPQLETAAKEDPDNPTIHLALGTALQRSGRKDEAAREFALQKQTEQKLNSTEKMLKKNVSGMPQ